MFIPKLSTVRRTLFTPPESEQVRYYLSMQLFLNLVWLVTLGWFSLYLEMQFSLGWVLFWLGLLNLTLLVSFYASRYIKNETPTVNNGRHNQLWLLLLMWIMLINSGLLYGTGGSINPLIHLLLLPLALGMLILSPLYFMALAVFSALLYAFLNHFYVPIMSLKVKSLTAFFAWHLHGSMLVFMLLVLFLALFILPLKFRLEKQQTLLQQHHALALRNEYFLSIASIASASAHKLSTPLNTLTFIQELLKTHVTSQQGHDYLQTMQEQLSVCNQALQTLRDRAEHAQKTNQKTLSFSWFLSDLKQGFALIHPQSNLLFQIHSSLIPTENFSTQADPSLKLALMNLLDNAARYSPEFIEISWRLQAQTLQIAIRDNGGGIEDSQLFQLGQKPCKHRHGLGMGVFLSRMIIERFQGQIKFNNYSQADTPNLIGLEVVITLPSSVIYLGCVHAQ